MLVAPIARKEADAPHPPSLVDLRVLVQGLRFRSLGLGFRCKDVGTESCRWKVKKKTSDVPKSAEGKLIVQLSALRG